MYNTPPISQEGNELSGDARLQNKAFLMSCLHLKEQEYEEALKQNRIFHELKELRYAINDLRKRIESL